MLTLSKKVDAQKLLSAKQVGQLFVGRKYYIRNFDDEAQEPLWQYLGVGKNDCFDADADLEADRYAITYSADKKDFIWTIE
jgi:hypothetical protein